jgi:hypothetical protein
LSEAPIYAVIAKENHIHCLDVVHVSKQELLRLILTTWLNASPNVSQLGFNMSE